MKELCIIVVLLLGACFCAGCAEPEPQERSVLQRLDELEKRTADDPEVVAAWQEQVAALKEMRRGMESRERSLLVWPASSSPEAQAAAMKANGYAPRWEGR
jgi:hypothetical protein